MTAAALAELAPGRFSFGIGSSSPVAVEEWNAAGYDRPVARVRDTVRFLRQALAGQRVDEQYETFAVRGFRLARLPEVPPQLLVAALRPRMLALARDEADGAITTCLASSDVATVAGVLGPGCRLVSWLLVCPSRDAERRAGLGPPTAGRLPVRPRLRRAAPLVRVGPRCSKRSGRPGRDGDRRAAAAAVSDPLVDALVVHGDARAVRRRHPPFRRIRRHRAGPVCAAPGRRSHDRHRHGRRGVSSLMFRPPGRRHRTDAGATRRGDDTCGPELPTRRRGLPA